LRKTDFAKVTPWRFARCISLAAKESPFLKISVYLRFDQRISAILAGIDKKRKKK